MLRMCSQNTRGPELCFSQIKAFRQERPWSLLAASTKIVCLFHGNKALIVKVFKTDPKWGKRFTSLRKCFGFRAILYLFKIKVYCSTIEDLLIWLKCFQSYLHDSVITLASESLLRPKKQHFSKNFSKSHLGCSCSKPFNLKYLFKVH